MTHIHYNVTTSYIDPAVYPDKPVVSVKSPNPLDYITDESLYTFNEMVPSECESMTYELWEDTGMFPTGNNIIMHECNHPEPVQIPDWMHVDPINTQIDLLSVADMLSDYDYTPGLLVTVEDLTNPKPMDLPYGKNVLS